MKTKTLTVAKQLLKEIKQEMIDDGVISDDGYYHATISQVQTLLDEIEDNQQTWDNKQIHVGDGMTKVKGGKKHIMWR
jgi:saccharopine dehydrogenase-like NADP-dependent oxidoreductase